MEKSTFKRQLMFVVCMLMCGLSIQAADDGLITDQVIIDNLVAGTLPQRISSDKKNLITNLKINGEINGTDLRLIREMATSYYDCDIEKETGGQLSILDLSDAKIVSGGEYYYQEYDYYEDSYNNYFTKDNEIGYMAFWACNRLTTLTLPPNLISIGNKAFDSSGLERLNIPSGITSIGDYTFRDCRNLTSINLPSGLSSIGEHAFEGCKNLTSVTFPSTPFSIDYGAFSGCGFKSLTLPTSITEISPYAFSGCVNLTSVTFPSCLTSTGTGIFSGCENLTSVTFPSTPFSIDYGAFMRCGFKSLTLPPSITQIGSEAFWGCKRLKRLTLSPSLTSIGEGAFGDCERLRTLTIPLDLTAIDSLNYISGLERFVPIFPSGINSVYVAWQTPIPAGGFFEGFNFFIENCTLYVPQGTRQRYSGTEVWRDFGEIKEYDVSGVDKVDNHSEAKEVSRFSLDGQRLPAPVKGLNIVRYSDGSIKKVVVN